MSSTLGLATRLRAMEDGALIAALRRRAVGSAGIRDLLDLAEALLDTEAIQACLVRLDRPTLAALWSGGLADDRFLLTDETGATLPEVREQLSRWPALGLPDPAGFGEAGTELSAASEGHEDATAGTGRAADPAESTPAATRDREQTDRLAAERAFATTTAITQLLFELDREPARLLARGAVGVPEAKRLAEALAIDDGRLPALLELAERAGLLTRDARLLAPAEGHRSWLRRETASRWAELAGAWVAGLPAAVRDEFTADPDPRAEADHAGASANRRHPGLRKRLARLYPGGRDWLDDLLDEGLAVTELLGVTAGEELSTAGAALLTTGPDRASELLAPRMPSPVDRVYLQHDLTIVAPGPLAPELDLRMRGVADAESHALASAYRVSAAGIERALGRGETAETILGFLESVSLGPVPQPLRYLVAETEARYGRLRVVAAEPGGGADAATRIRSDDPALLHTVLVDSALSPLALTPSGSGELLSPRDPEVVYWSLSEARYPVVLDGLRGAAPRRPRPAGRPPRDDTSGRTADPIAELVGRLRLADRDRAADLGRAWLTRRLEAAIRSKSAVTVSVRMPDGSIADHRLEPASVAGGRLRARDPLSEIERTLPLASIIAITPE